MRENSFFKEYWAEFSEAISNHADKRWRVNDPNARLEKWQQERWEGNCNGLMLINFPLQPHELDAAEFYGEVWGGHFGCANRRFMLNGRCTYTIPDVKVSLNNCCYHYPTLPLQTYHLVSGVNSLQFSVDRGTSFLGHFMLDEACLRGYLPAEHKELKACGLSGFSASVQTDSNGFFLKDKTRIWLKYDEKYAESIASVEYYGKYYDFDDTGSCEAYDWHGYTVNRRPVNNIGISVNAPFEVIWDTTMIPDQDRPIEICALVRFRNGISYYTPANGRQFLSGDRQRVKIFPCSSLPSPFYSRANQVCVGSTFLSPQDLEGIDTVLLQTRVWDGGEGTVKNYFTLNGNQYDICTGKAVHKPYETKYTVPVEHLAAGENIFRLCSDTEHHGIEVLLPGPVLKIRYKKR